MTTTRRGRGLHWLRILVPSVLILVWLAAAGFGGPTFGKLSDVSQNDQASFLPASAESTAVTHWRKKFTDSDAIPAVVLFTSEKRIPRARLAGFAETAQKLGAVEGVQEPASGAKTAVAGPIPSEDGKAVELMVPITDQNDIVGVVDRLRTIAHDAAGDGLTAYVTGPGGLTADMVNAFGGIDGILLVVAILAVFVILLIVYRALLLPLLVLGTSMFALCAAILLVYAFASWGWITLSGMSQGILSILVIGATTDYSLLLVARYREALAETESRWDAVWTAWRGALAPIVASGATVILALLCLLFSDLNSNRSLGPIGALGIVFALLAALTLLPALLAVCGRAAFWPFRPRPHHAEHEASVPAGSGPSPAEAPRRPAGAHAGHPPPAGLEGATPLWRRVGGLVARRPRTVWIAAFVVLLACCAALPQLQASGVKQTDLVLGSSEAADGQSALGRHFDAGSGSPVLVVAREKRAEEVLKRVRGTEGIGSAALYTGSGRPDAGRAAVVRDGRVLVEGTLTHAADSERATDTVRTLRSTLPDVDGDVLVGGVTATNLDTNTTAQSDLVRIIPIVLIVILVILMLLLRAFVAPLVLIGSVLLSYGATMGVSALVFDHVLHFPGADPAVPLFGFVFLVALGVDYNIFLMTRVREESLLLGTGPGILRGLSMTGGVITSAGVVLAATFAALSVIPILFLVQVAFIVAFGVLLDTIVVRSLLVPALAHDLGRAVWWPSRLGRP